MENRGHTALALMASARRAHPCSARLPLPRRRRPWWGEVPGPAAEDRMPNTVPGTPGLKARPVSPEGQSPSLSKVCFHVICKSCMRFSESLWHTRQGDSCLLDLLQLPPPPPPAGGRRLARGSPSPASSRPSFAHTGEMKPGPLPHSIGSGAVFRNTI